MRIYFATAAAVIGLASVSRALPFTVDIIQSNSSSSSDIATSQIGIDLLTRRKIQESTPGAKTGSMRQSLKHPPDSESEQSEREGRFKVAAHKGAQQHQGHAVGASKTSSKVIYTFWTKEEFEARERERNHGQSEYPGPVPVRDTKCTEDQKKELESPIKNLILKSSEELGLQGTPSIVPEINTNCLSQWLPTYNVFNFIVKKGKPGKRCASTKPGEGCWGIIYLRTKDGKLTDRKDGEDFYSSATSAEETLVHWTHHQNEMQATGRQGGTHNSLAGTTANSPGHNTPASHSPPHT